MENVQWPSLTLDTSILGYDSPNGPFNGSQLRSNQGSHIQASQPHFPRFDVRHFRFFWLFVQGTAASGAGQNHGMTR